MTRIVTDSRDEAKRPLVIFFFRAEDGIRDVAVTVVQTCALPIFRPYLSCRCCVSFASADHSARVLQTCWAAIRDRTSFSGLQIILSASDGRAPPRRSQPPPIQIGRASCRERVQLSVSAAQSR